MRRSAALAFAVSVTFWGRAIHAQTIHPRIVDATLAPNATFVVSLCAGDAPSGCVPICGGTLLAPNLVLTSRHCADTVKRDAIDCARYQFDEALRSADTIWVSTSSPAVQPAFHRGTRWDVPLARACGHDLALLTLETAMTEATTAPAAVQHDDVARARGALLEVYGYGQTAPDIAPDGQRHVRDTRLLCLGGYDSCASIPDGRTLVEQEFAIDAVVCPGDSGSGVFDSGGALLGALARSIGGSAPCGYGVFTRLAPHALMLARVSREAGALGGYTPPSWVANAERSGNTPNLAPRAFGASCDADADCDTGSCRSYDGGLAWSCARPCSGTCGGACRAADVGTACFAEPARPPDTSGCTVTATTSVPCGLREALALSSLLGAAAIAWRRRGQRIR